MKEIPELFPLTFAACARLLELVDGNPLARVLCEVDEHLGVIRSITPPDCCKRVQKLRIRFGRVSFCEEPYGISTNFRQPIEVFTCHETHLRFGAREVEYWICGAPVGIYFRGDAIDLFIPVVIAPAANAPVGFAVKGLKLKLDEVDQESASYIDHCIDFLLERISELKKRAA